MTTTSTFPPSLLKGPSSFHIRPSYPESPTLFNIKSLRERGYTRIDLKSDILPSSDHSDPSNAILSSLFRYGASSLSDRDDGGTSAQKFESTEEINPRTFNGYHGFGGLSSGRYNRHRRGLVFSDGGWDPSDDVDGTCRRAHAVMHGICVAVMKAISADLGVDNLVERFGGSEGTFASSQWHLKMYMDSKKMEDTKTVEVLEGGRYEVKRWLEAHTDPSLVSIVVHDCVFDEQEIDVAKTPAKNASKSGLQVKSKESGWIDVPYEGHSIATIFIGSVFGILLPQRVSNLYPPCRHRVVVPEHQEKQQQQQQDQNNHENMQRRMAATFFLRPQPQSKLSPIILDKTGVNSINNSRRRPPQTFGDWCDKVSKNYAGRSTKTKSTIETKSKTQPEPFRPLHNPPGSNTKCSLLYPSDGPLMGKEQYLGGDLSSVDDKIYCIPGHASKVLVIDPSNGDMVHRIGPNLSKKQFKWLRSVQVDGKIYGLPCHADAVLVIDPKDSNCPVKLLGHHEEWCDRTKIASTVHMPSLTPASNSPHSKLEYASVQWKYHGGCLSPFDGCIYCIPQSAERVLKINPRQETVEAIGPRFKGRLKWYGGLLGSDGAIYGIPYNAASILRIDPSALDPSSLITLHGNFTVGGHKWHGGIHSPLDNSIIAVPANADTILHIVPGKDHVLTNMWGDASVLRSGSHRTDGKYKFLGAMAGPDKNVYLIPSDADRVVKVNTSNGSLEEVGPNLNTVEPTEQNKWQNGITSQVDGAMYGIPLKGETILRIAVKELMEEMKGEEKHNNRMNIPVVSTVGGYYKGLNKWEGAVVGRNNVIYCMPLNHKAVLRIEPVSEC